MPRHNIQHDLTALIETVMVMRNRANVQSPVSLEYIANIRLIAERIENAMKYAEMRYVMAENIGTVETNEKFPQTTPVNG